MASADPVFAEAQLPRGDEIYLDHIGHFVGEAEPARAALARAGFLATPLSIQTNPDPEGGAARLTGTGNTCVMLERGYLEVLFETADTPLSRQLRAALDRYPGVHLAAFAVAEAEAAHRRLGAAGFATQPLVSLQRFVETESGEAQLRFSVARVEPQVMPEGRIQILTHHSEQALWQGRWLAHPNTADALLDLVLVVEDLEETGARYARFLDIAPRQLAGGGLAFDSDRGSLLLLPAKAAIGHFRLAPVDAPPYFAGYGLRVRSLKTAEQVLKQAGLDPWIGSRHLLQPFPVALGRGAWVFVENAVDLPWRAQ